MDRKSILTEYFTNQVMRNRNAKLGGDDDLLGSGILDSLGILQLVAFIEKIFMIKIPDEDVVFVNFKSVNSLVGYLEKY